MKLKEKQTGAICGDGMCPFIPCKKFPNCNHLEEQLKYDKKWSDENKSKD